MGSDGGEHNEETILKLIRLGRAIAERGHLLITGGCPGLPHAAARAAQEAGGLTIGISPGLTRYEHEHKYCSPTDAYDVFIYARSGLMGREVLNIRSSDVPLSRADIYSDENRRHETMQEPERRVPQ